MERYPKGMRLRRRSEYLAVQSRGTPVHTRHFVLVAMAGSGRLGVTVSKKVGNAVTRNRIKRLVREATRRTRWLPAALDVVVIAKRQAATVSSMSIVSSELTHAAERLR